MKKKIQLFMILCLFLFLTNEVTVYATELQEEEEQELVPDTEIIFDPDVVTNKTAAKSTLADMHGVFVFRSAFITQEALVKEQEKKNREAIENTVLTSTQPAMDYQKWVDLVLTSDTEKFIKDVYIEEEDSTLFMWIYCIIFSIAILFLAIRIEAELKKKKREKNAHGREKKV